MKLIYARSTQAVPSGQPISVIGRMCNDLPFTDNLNLVKKCHLMFKKSGGELYLDALVVNEALRSWKIEGNQRKLRSNGRLPLWNTISADLTLLSTDPLDRNLMRVDPIAVSLRPGDPFPGDLPPGPAPLEGDWFTELQDRFKDALQ